MPTETRIEFVIAFLLAVAIVVYEGLTTALGRGWAAVGATATGHSCTPVAG